MLKNCVITSSDFMCVEFSPPKTGGYVWKYLYVEWHWNTTVRRDNETVWRERTQTHRHWIFKGKILVLSI